MRQTGHDRSVAPDDATAFSYETQDIDRNPGWQSHGVSGRSPVSTKQKPPLCTIKTGVLGGMNLRLLLLLLLLSSSSVVVVATVVVVLRRRRRRRRRCV